LSSNSLKKTKDLRSTNLLKYCIYFFIITIKVMLDNLEYNKDSEEEKKRFTLALIDLFKEIDVNGDGK
jgi:hypothetical protein